MSVKPVGTWRGKYTCGLFLWAQELLRVQGRGGERCAHDLCVAISQREHLCSWAKVFLSPPGMLHTWERSQLSPLSTLHGCPGCHCWWSWRERGREERGRMLQALWHLLEHDHGSLATPQAAWDGPSQRQNTREEPTSRWVWWFGWKLLASQHWNLSFLFSLSLPFSCLSCCLWPD